MNEDQKIFDNWNKVVEAYESKFMNLSLYDETYDLFLHKLKRNQAKVLEIGCGPGNIARYLLRRQPDLELMGTDLVPKMIERARINVPQAEFLELDCRNIMSLGSNFDGVVCGFVLPYLSVIERKQLIVDCSKLLSNSGILYLSFVKSEFEESKITMDVKGNSMRFNYHSHVEIIQDLTSNSFELQHEFSVPFKAKDASLEIHTILIAKRVA